MAKKIYNLVSNQKYLLVLNIILIIIMVVLLISLKGNLNSDDEIIRDKIGNYKFTNPILDCESSSQDEHSVISSSDVYHKVESLKNNYKLENISLYFRDLNNGPWIGINEKTIFSPASLLKTPVLMALLKYSEENNNILNKEIDVKINDIIENFHQSIIPPNTLKPDTVYTLGQIADSMIVNSDNSSAGLIIKNIPEKYIHDVFYSIGVPYKDTNSEVELTVKDYAGFFRVLFNSSYLNREMSEKALEILSRSQYKSGLVGGVPNNIIVSHKFGERIIGDTKQLHDCGIVYYPNRPYILCIMTKGDDLIKQQDTIKELSSYIYQKVDSYR